MESLSCGGDGWFAQQVTLLADGWVGGLVGGWKVLSCGGWGGWREHWVTWLADCWVGGWMESLGCGADGW